MGRAGHFCYKASVTISAVHIVPLSSGRSNDITHVRSLAAEDGRGQPLCEGRAPLHGGQPSVGEKLGEDFLAVVLCHTVAHGLRVVVVTVLFRVLFRVRG